MHKFVGNLLNKMPLFKKSTQLHWLSLIGAALALFVYVHNALAAANFEEAVLMIPKKGFFTIELETTIYKPEGSGPFPLALINHGKAPGDPRFQNRYQPLPAVSYFLQRGYVVAVPMRQGFSKSTGTYIGGGCNVESNGRLQADDVVATLDYMVALPYIDKT